MKFAVSQDFNICSLSISKQNLRCGIATVLFVSRLGKLASREPILCLCDGGSFNLRFDGVSLCSLATASEEDVYILISVSVYAIRANSVRRKDLTKLKNAIRKQIAI